MIATLVNIDRVKTSILFIIIEKDNFERMKQADPITLETRKAGGILPNPLYPDRFEVMIAYEEDQQKVYQLAKDGNFAEMVKYVMRGAQFIKGEDGTDLAFSLTKALRGEGAKH